MRKFVVVDWPFLGTAYIVAEIAEEKASMYTLELTEAEVEQLYPGLLAKWRAGDDSAWEYVDKMDPDEREQREITAKWDWKVG
jgi:hypothetical protein